LTYFFVFLNIDFNFWKMIASYVYKCHHTRFRAQWIENSQQGGPFIAADLTMRAN